MKTDLEARLETLKLARLERTVGWISVKDRLPEDIGEPYQVIGSLIKENGGNYKGSYIRKFVQDWNIRKWPNNFVAWCYDPIGHVYVDNISMPDKDAAPSAEQLSMEWPGKLVEDHE
ncbi:MAG TPA: hypothetical protein EYN67_14350 [Flavobacteriales bacterium]|nr:hypothetical protein [Flavobacteriales bacterium]